MPQISSKAALIRARSSKIEVEAARCANSLAYYIPRAWKVVEPATPFVDNWHIGLVSEYLTALPQLQSTNLLINIPPRHMKSLLTVVMWPTWVWITKPASRWMTGSYSLTLATRDALKSAIDVVRPLPFVALPRPSMTDVAGGIIRRKGEKEEPAA